MFFAWRSPLANREPAGETFVPQIRELSGSGNNYHELLAAGVSDQNAYFLAFSCCAGVLSGHYLRGRLRGAIRSTATELVVALLQVMRRRRPSDQAILNLGGSMETQTCE
jgi:hypothetical protein